MDYIRRDKAIARFTFEQGNYIPEKVIDGHDNVIAVRTIKRVLRDLPAEDVVPARHGRWILEREPDGTPYCFHCSVCDSDFRHIGIMTATDFCPDCGARMDKEAADAN